MDSSEPHIVWEPFKGSSQEIALDSRCHHTLYHGTRGVGKTIVQAMRFRRRVGLGYGRFWKGVIFDQEYKSLQDIQLQTERVFNEFDDGARFLRSPKDYMWVWPTGETLLFRAISSIDDYWKFHGNEFAFIGWNELTKYPNGELYDMMMSCNRSSFVPQDYPLEDGSLLPDIPLEVFATTNPFGVGHRWVYDRFIRPAPSGVVVEKHIEVISPKTRQKEITTVTQIAIGGFFFENPKLSPTYLASLLQDTNKNRKRAWTEGAWDISDGGALDDLWDNNVHMVPRFSVPFNWRLTRSFDWGSTEPFSVLWWAVANGEEVEIPDGVGGTKVWCPQPGSMVLFHEWYGAEGPVSNKGLRLPATVIAERIIEIESDLKKHEWISIDVSPGPADNQIHNVNEVESASIASKMETAGVTWERSDKSSGSRVNGLELVRDRLHAALKGEGPGLYVMNHCDSFLSLVPPIPMDPENPLDVLQKGYPDHSYDSLRYAVTYQQQFTFGFELEF